MQNAAFSPPPLETQEQPGCWARHWKKIVGCGCFALLVAGTTLFALIFFGAMGMMKNSAAYQESFAKAQGNAAVEDKLGLPIKPGFLVSGKVNTSGSSGEAAIHYTISGLKGKGAVDVEGEKHAGDWKWTLMQVKLEDGTVINLLDEPPPEPETVEPPPDPPVDSPPAV